MDYPEKSKPRTPQSESRDGHQERHKQPCRDGLDCILYDSAAHCATYSHLCRFAQRCHKKDAEPHLTHEPNPAQRCQYDEKCVKLDNIHHRASFWHSNKPDYLRACRDQTRCTDHSFEHRSKYSHGEYKSIFNSASSTAHSRHDRDHKHPQQKGSRDHSTDKSSKTIDRQGCVSSKYSPPGRRRSRSQGRSKSGNRSKSREKPQDRRRSKSHGRSQSREKSKTHKKSDNREKTEGRVRSKSQSRSKSREKPQDRRRSKSHGRSKSREKSHNQRRSQSREKSKTHKKSDTQEKTEGRVRSKSRGRSQSREIPIVEEKRDKRKNPKAQSRSQSRGRSKSREKPDNNAFQDSTNRKDRSSVSSQSPRRVDRPDKKSTRPTRDELDADAGESISSAERSSRDRRHRSHSDDRDELSPSVSSQAPKSILRPARRSKSRESPADNSRNNAARDQRP